MLIELTRGYKAIIDDESYAIIKGHKWSAVTIYRNNGTVINNYAVTRIGKYSTVRMHRLITDVAKELVIDHIDGNGLNNCLSNLRICEQYQNAMNKRPQLNTASIFKGVNWHKGRKKWIATIRINKERKYLGGFIAEEDAAKAYDAAALELFGEFARPNFK